MVADSFNHLILHQGASIAENKLIFKNQVFLSHDLEKEEWFQKRGAKSKEKGAKT